MNGLHNKGSPMYYINTWKEAQIKGLYCPLAQLYQISKRVMPYISETTSIF